MHNLSTQINQTMLSTEIVKIINELREKDQAELRHDNFLVKIEKVLGVDAPKFLGVYKNQQGIDRKCYRLPKRESQLMVMSESYKVQAAVYDRMTELESKNQLLLPNFNDPVEAARAWANELEAKRIVIEKLEVIQPKANALDRIATESEGTVNITAAAKTLQMQPKKLFDWLSENKWIYRRAGGKSWLAYQNRLQSGWLEHKIEVVKLESGADKICEQVLVTAKGLTRIASELN